MDEFSSVITRLLAAGIIITGLILAWMLVREKEKWDTSMNFRGQRYLFRIHITLQNAEEYDLNIYSNHLYESITDIGMRTSFFEVNRHNGFLRKGQRLKVLGEGKEIWIRSDDISTVSLEILDNQSQQKI